MNTEFFGSSKTYIITAEFKKGIIEKFIFWNETQYRKKRIELRDKVDIISIYIVESETTTTLETNGS